MLDQLIGYRCKASTVLESLVAALILLLSFSAGVVIYNKVMLSGPSNTGLRASYSQKSLADSLEMSGELKPGVLLRGEFSHQVLVDEYPGFSGIRQLEIIASDGSGKQLFTTKRLIPTKHE